MPTNLPLPVTGRITSSYGYRKAPKPGASTFHQGIDIAAPIGTPVKAPLAGNVIVVKFSVTSGNMVELQHTGGLVTAYFHLASTSVLVGQQVQAGAVIGYVGMTGNTTGPHLHYSTRINGQYVDPLTVTNTTGLELPPPSAGTAHDSYLPQPPVDKDYFVLITVDSKQLNTVQKFLDKYGVNMSPTEFLAYQNNSTRITDAYSKADLRVEGNRASANRLNVGTILAVPLYKMASQNPYRVNQTLLTGQSYEAFIEAEIAKLVRSPQYRRLNKGNSEASTGSVYIKDAKVSVWVWSKAHSPSGAQLIDISPFIQTLRTSNGENGGNFTITVPHITVDRTEKDLEFMYKEYRYYNDRSYINRGNTHRLTSAPVRYTADYTNDSNDLQKGQQFYQRKQSLLQVLIQSNDIVYIRFEKLEIDSADYSDELGSIFVPSSKLGSKVFDMIGLVDDVIETHSAQGVEGSVSINGRDLSKLLIDDGVFFFPVEYAVQNREQIIKNSTGSKAAKRLTAPSGLSADGFENNVQFNLNGQLLSDVRFNFDLTQTLEDWLIFIFSQLTNIDIAPDALFSSYTDKTFVISRDTAYQPDGSLGYKRILAEGIWQACKLVTDKGISTRRIADASLATDTGSLLNLVRKVAQKPFAEFRMDTYGNKFYFILRRPPFSEASYKTNKCINVYEADVLSDSLKQCNEVYTWYRLTPMGSIIDTSDGNMMLELPAVMLPEYAEIWGSKVLDITTNYLDFDMSVSSETKANLQNIIQQGQDDLDWLIETHAYLPFTRVGTITIKRDRRIKAGMHIRYFGTGELFYVDDVSHVASFGQQTEAMTILNVSRGIVEAHYSKYFNLVNLKRNGRNKDTWTVNADVFKFLLQRKQF